MSKKSYIRDTERFFEGDASEKPKLDHANFASRINEDLMWENSTEVIVDYLKLNESKIVDPWPTSRAGRKHPTAHQANMMMLRVHNDFSKFPLKVIYNEIVEFFGLDYIKFYNMLGDKLKAKLKKELSDNMCLDTFERVDKREQIKRGGWQPSLK